MLSSFSRTETDVCFIGQLVSAGDANKKHTLAGSQIMAFRNISSTETERIGTGQLTSAVSESTKQKKKLTASPSSKRA